MVQSYFEQIWSKTELKCRALYISVPRYMIAIKDNISEKSEYIEHIKKNILIADIVIWDEVRTKGLTQFEHENIMSLINARIDSGKSNIYTSNLTDRELLEAVGKRLHSRISLTSHSVELKGKDTVACDIFVNIWFSSNFALTENEMIGRRLRIFPIANLGKVSTEEFIEVGNFSEHKNEGWQKYIQTVVNWIVNTDFTKEIEYFYSLTK
jgi:hypothetical protein